MGSPSHFYRLVTKLRYETIHRPGIHKGSARVAPPVILRIAFGNLDSADAQVQRQLRVAAAELDALDERKFLQTLFHKMGDQAGIRTIGDQGRSVSLATQAHCLLAERIVGQLLSFIPALPGFETGIQVHDPVFPAPCH